MTLKRILEDVDLLEPMAPSAHRVLQIAGDPKSAVTDLVEVIQYDQAITANLLRICNSAGVGLCREIHSVKQAAAYLGMEKVACLVMLGHSSANLRKAQEGYDLLEGELWRHSVASALISQDLAEKRVPKMVPLLFTAALLKDIGKVVLSRYVKDLFQEIIAEVREGRLSFVEAEKKILGIDHAELGGRIVERWRFNETLADLIRNHHTPDKASPQDVSLPIVYLGDCICMMLGIGLGSDGLAYRYYAQAADRLHFTEADWQRSMIGLREKLATVEALVGLAKEERIHGV